MTKNRHRSLVHLEGAPPEALLAPFYDWAKDWFQAAAEEVAMQHGGKCGVIASAVLSSAAASLAWERYVLTLAAKETEHTSGIGLAKAALSFGDSARKSLAAISQLSKTPTGFVDPLADDDPKEDAEREQRAEKIHAKMKKALKKTDKRLQGEPAWMTKRDEIEDELSMIDDTPLDDVVQRYEVTDPAGVLAGEPKVAPEDPFE